MSDGRLSRRRLLQVAAGGTALGATAVVARTHERTASPRASGPADARRPVLRAASGRDHHARAGPAALRGVRRARRDVPRAAGGPAPHLDRGGRRHDGRAGDRRSSGIERPVRASSRHRRGAGAPARAADGHRRLRALAVRRALRPGAGAARPRSSRSRSSPTTRSTRRAATATSASRRAPTTRRSRCTPCGTSRGSRTASPPSASASSDSGARHRPAPTQVTARNLFGFKDGTSNLKAEDAGGDAAARVGGAR